MPNIFQIILGGLLILLSLTSAFGAYQVLFTDRYNTVSHKDRMRYSDKISEHSRSRIEFTRLLLSLTPSQKTARMPELKNRMKELDDELDAISLLNPDNI